MRDSKDVTTKAEAKDGFTVIRHVSRFAYARSGNAHNPTPEYFWTLFYKGQAQGIFHRRSGVKAFILSLKGNS